MTRLVIAFPISWAGAITYAGVTTQGAGVDAPEAGDRLGAPGDAPGYGSVFALPS